jgi:FdhD protein
LLRQKVPAPNAGGEIDSIDVVAHPNGFELQMWLPDAQAKTLSLRRRAMAGPVGCGLCGIDSLDQWCVMWHQ